MLILDFKEFEVMNLMMGVDFFSCCIELFNWNAF